MKRRGWWLLGCALLVVALMLMPSMAIKDGHVPNDPDISFTSWTEEVITLGHVAYAAGTVDYTFDGTDDNVQFQAALDALPATGGRLVCVSATTIDFSATVSRAIDDVIIEGAGDGTYFTNDGGTAIFDTGTQSGWVFRNFRTDAGFIDVAATSDYIIENVTNNTTLIGKTTRGATIIVAASDASESSKAQADYLCDGTNDDIQIQAAIGSGGVRVSLTEGTFTGGKINVGFSDTTISGQGTSTIYTLVSGTNDNVFEAKAAAQGAISGITLSDFAIDANSDEQASSPADGANAIYIDDCDNVRLSNLDIKDTYSHVVGLRGVRYTTIDDVDYSGTSSESNHGIDFDISDSAASNYHCGMVNCNFVITAGFGDLCKLESSHFVSVIGNTIDCNSVSNGISMEGVNAGGGSAGGVSNISIIGNDINSPSGSGIAVEGVWTGPVTITGNAVKGSGAVGLRVFGNSRDIGLSGNTVTSATTLGVQINDAYDISVTNGVLSGSMQDGIAVEGDSSDFVIANNIIEYNGYHGVQIASGCNYGVISGNTVQYNEGAYGGIVLHGGDNVGVTGNLVRFNKNQGINLHGASRCVISGNVVVSNGWTCGTGAASKDAIRFYDNGASYCLYNIVTGNNIYDNATDTTSDLSSDAASGQKDVVVDNPYLFYLNQVVTVSDDSPDTETNIVDSITYSTSTLTMLNNLANDYGTAQNALVTGKQTQRRPISEEGNSDYNTFRGNNMTSNAAEPYFAGADTQLDVDSEVRSLVALDLSGAATDIDVFYATENCIIAGYTIFYTEASSADAGVTVRVGRYQSGVALDDDYFDTVTSEASKALGYSKHYKYTDLSHKAISAGDTVTVGTAGGKIGTGEVIIVLQILEMAS